MSKIRKSARGQACTIRIPGYCNFNPETTVLCHLPGGGMGMKRKDREAAYGCSACHDVIDGRVQTSYTREQIKLMHLEGVMRTQDILEVKGLLITK